MFQGPDEETRQRLTPTVDTINSLEASLQSLADADLRAKAEALRSRARSGEGEEALLPEAFALVREATRRTLGLRHYDVQLMGGIVLHEGGVAEMATGEGKTLVAILPAFLHSLGGKGVHVVTTNDYLAQRDAELVGQPLRFLGASVGVVHAGLKSAERRRAYACDATYVSNSELGFDYLRDQLAGSPAELVLRPDEPFHFAVVDEADSILIDEARTPLVISAPADQPCEKYAVAQELVGSLREPIHYTLLEKEKRIVLTEEGARAAESLLQKTDLFDPEDPWAGFVVNAINAREFFNRDKQYIVQEGKVIIVDEFTGRPMPGRRWEAGMHQAVEAKEKVEIEPETTTLAKVSYQSFFRLYGTLSGMTGTAASEEREFQEFYGLKVSVVPTNEPCRRQDQEDLVYMAEGAKWAAVVREVEAAHATGRPVLVGTTSVENSEMLASRLSVPCELLNAKPENLLREAEIVANAGRKGSVTISTNMAGRGTDILLGGSSQAMARLRLEAALLKNSTDSFPPLSAEAEALVEAAVADVGNVTETGARELVSRTCEVTVRADDSQVPLRLAYEKLEQDYREVTEAERREVLALGGLYVIGTERHESRRVDNQLRGRSGRQGDPGEARFFLSLKDNVFRVFGGSDIADLTGGGDADVPVNSPFLGGALDEAQRQVESFFYAIRKDVFQFDQVMDNQRRALYALRRQVLVESDDSLQRVFREFHKENIDQFLTENVDASQPVESWPFDVLANHWSTMFMGILKVEAAQLRERAGGGGEAGRAAIQEWMTEAGLEAIQRKEDSIAAHGPGLEADARRQVMLLQVDNFWRGHLRNMEFLQNSAKLRSYGEQDPLVEYKTEGYKTFLRMMVRIRRNSVFYLFNFNPRPLLPIETQHHSLPDAAALRGHCDSAALAALCAELKQRLPAAESFDGRGLVPLRDLREGLQSAGLMSLGEQLSWLLEQEGLEVLEDNFAKSYYVALR